MGKLTAVAVAGLLFFSAGCGAAANKAIKNAVKDATGCDVSNSKTTCKNKSTSGSVSVGNASLPDGWPSVVPTPKHDTITLATSNTDNGVSTWSATFSSKLTASAALKAYLVALKAKGFTVTEQSSGSAGGTSSATASANNADYKVTVLAFSSTVSGEVSSLTIGVQQKTAQEKKDDAASKSASDSAANTDTTSSDTSNTDTSNTDTSNTDTSS